MIAYITDAQIEIAKRTTEYSVEPQHRHNDCIRAAYMWLDAQRTIKNPTGIVRGIKHNIEKWAGFHISRSDVEVAAQLHPDIYGPYPFFNIHGDFVLPADCRLIGLEGTGKRPRVREFEAYVTFEKPDSLAKGVRVKIERLRATGRAMSLEQVMRSQQRYKRW